MFLFGDYVEIMVNSYSTRAPNDRIPERGSLSSTETPGQLVGARGYIVSFAAVFWDVTQRFPQRALRDIPKNGCEGD